MAFPSTVEDQRMSTITLRWTLHGARAVIFLNEERIGTMEFVSTEAGEAMMAVLSALGRR